MAIKKFLGKINKKELLIILFFMALVGIAYIAIGKAYIAFVDSENSSGFDLSIFDVSGNSMLPTFTEGWRVELKTCKEWNCAKSIKRGDIIIFKKFDSKGLFKKDLVKRIIAIPGDKIQIVNGEVYLNDIVLNEPYILTPNSTYINKEQLAYINNPNYPYVFIPKDSYFVMGDNRKYSEDSRFFGPIKLDSIIGFAEFLKYNKENQRAWQVQ